MALFAALFCTACLGGVIVRVAQIAGDYRWAKRYGTAVERSIVRFDVVRVTGAVCGILGAAVRYLSHHIGDYYWGTEVLFLIAVVAFPLSVGMMARAKKVGAEQARIVDEAEEISQERVTLRAV